MTSSPKRSSQSLAQSVPVCLRSFRRFRELGEPIKLFGEVSRVFEPRGHFEGVVGVKVCMYFCVPSSSCVCVIHCVFDWSVDVERSSHATSRA